MADRKISDLTALTTPASGDYLPIVDISEAAAASKNKRITIEELMRGVPDGTAAAPGIAFETDPNTGIYSPGADQLAVATNGVARLTTSTTAVSSSLAIDHPLGAVGTPSITFTGDLNTGIWSPTADTIAFSEGGTEAMRIDSSGRLLVGTSSANTSGAKLQTSDGLTFPATAVASADPNTLDDYEEGTWTPSLGGTATYNAQIGTYTKIGNVVTVSGRIHVNIKGTGSGTIVSGLPFTSAASYPYGIAIGKYSNIANSAFTVYGDLSASSSSFELFCTTAAGTANYVSSVFADSAQINFTFTYRV